jgi:hypothetical protein
MQVAVSVMKHGHMGQICSVRHNMLLMWVCVVAADATMSCKMVCQCEALLHHFAGSWIMNT